MCNYHFTVVPAFRVPHERYDELLDAALCNCVNIGAFRWRASEKISAPILKSLVSLKKLRILDLRLGSIEHDMFTVILCSLLDLDEITFRGVSELLTPSVVAWIGRMSTLQSLTIEVTSQCVLDYHSMLNPFLECHIFGSLNATRSSTAKSSASDVSQLSQDYLRDDMPIFAGLERN